MPTIRKPIITVLGHVDHGKTSFLDAIRGTTVVEKEAGRITQHIGATEVPIEAVTKIAGPLLEKYKFNLTIPGLLFIDTPGHEAFSNLRRRGGSIADLAVLVIDIMQACQPQTSESIEILKAFKVPFVIVANKVDLIQGWEKHPGMSFTESIKLQEDYVQTDLDEKIYCLVGEMFHKGFVCERFDRISDFTKQVAIIPLSAKDAEGLPEVLLFLAGLSQKFLESQLRIEVSGQGKGTVLEVKEEKGLGKTIDVILYDGSLKVGDEIIVGAVNGFVKTKIRALLQPKPLDEIRSPEQKFDSVREVSAAVGIKIAAPNLEGVLAGSPLIVYQKPEDEEEVLKEVVGLNIESEALGPVVRTDALGSLEALTMLLDKAGIKPRFASVGEVSRRDIIEAVGVAKEDKFKGVVFAFNTKLNDGAVEELKKNPVKVFSANVIYRLIEDYEKWVSDENAAEKKSVLEKIVFPARIIVVRNCIFRNANPAIVGVKVLGGKLRPGAKLFNGEKLLGEVIAIQDKGSNLQELKQGQEAAISITDAVCGRNLFEEDELLTVLSVNDYAEILKIKDAFTQAELDLAEEIRNKLRKQSK
ncbi:MAG: translation initiation factor IF-2 [Candidatus Diapherotrites archaeon]|nr:translation initiation factor IF-2 [Candidatus Diapherotrites archaeon]